jgi:hypothetical protein
MSRIHWRSSTVRRRDTGGGCLYGDPVSPHHPRTADANAQGGEAYAQHSGHLLGSSTSRHSGIEDLQNLTAIHWGGQSSPKPPGG